MGTNYYLKFKERKINQPDLHIGKKSYGWQFSFQAHESDEYYDIPNLKSKKEYESFLKKHKDEIFNEYNENISFDDFFDIVHSSMKNTKNKNHTDYMFNEYLKKYPYEDISDNFKDNEGYAFCLTDFS